MKLANITIKNYRSIEELSFDINQLEDETYTYGLIGVNEAGKSSILKAMALKDSLRDVKGQVLPIQKDFKHKELPIEIEYFFILNQKEINECKEHLKTQDLPINLSDISLNEIKLIISFEHNNPNRIMPSIEIVQFSEENEEKVLIEKQLTQIILDKSHKSIFWTAEDRYLISQPINLDQFAANPDGISIPLKNCFLLAGISDSDIQARVTSLANDSTEIEELQTILGHAVTKQIRRVWPKHPIEITFLISSGVINFHVKDLNVNGKAKTADQRSDGFRQFISFLLTISAQSISNELSNTILLLDEPEAHLHPLAQEDLLRELVKITKNKKNNIAFFATHSNYMIDKTYLNRNFKIHKPEATDITEKEPFNKKASSYASVTYEVFDIPSTDYHNELYGKAQALSGIESVTNFDVKIQELDKKCPKKDYKRSNGKTFQCTLPTYIRHQIHHPDNIENKRYTNNELRKSIELLIRIIEQLKADHASSNAKS